MADDSQPGRPGPEGIPQRRPLAGDEREVLHRVAGLLQDAPGYGGPVSPGLRAVIGDGTQPQERELTARDRADLSGIIRRLLEDWAGPRLFRDPTPASGLSGADIARLGLIWRAVSPDPEDPGRPLAVNAAGWSLPPGIPDDWVIACAPRPVRGPAGARAWQGEDRGHGRFYAAWAAGADDDVYWEDSGAREVVAITNHEIAAEAGRYLAACGLLPGEAGLTAAGVARRLGLPWREGILGDEQAGQAALGAILGLRRDDEDLAYNGSASPPRRELTGDERAFLSRLAGQAAADPRWAGEEVAQRPGIRAALGDGTRPQARPLTARERDDIGRMVMLIDGEYRHDRQRPGGQPLSPWTAELSGGDVARLRLIDNAITPRRGDRARDDQVFVNAADWAPPEPVPDGWVIGTAPVPLSGPVTWQDGHAGNGGFYAAAPRDDDPFDLWHAESDGTARQVKTVTDEEAAEAAYAFLAGYQCTAPEDAGMTIAEVAADLGYPLPAGRCDAAVAAVGATWTLRASRGDANAHWYAVHGTRARDWTAAAAARDGYLVTSAAAVPPGEASPAGATPGARAMITFALQYGWDVAYIRRGPAEQVTALNPEIPDYQVSQTWDARGRLTRPGDLENIRSRPRPRCGPAPGLPATASPSPAAREFPDRPAAAPPKGSRAARTRGQAPNARHTGPRP